MAEKLPLPNIADFYDSSTATLDANSFYKAWSDIYNSADYPDGYDFTPLLDYPSTNLSGISGSQLYDYATSGSKTTFDAISREIAANYRYALSGDNPAHTENFNSFLNSLNILADSSEFSLGIDSIDTSVYFIGLAIIITALFSIWAIKRALGLFK